MVQYLVGWLVQHTVDCVTKADGTKHCTHWDAIFYMLVIGDVLAALCLSHLVYRDLKYFCRRRRVTGKVGARRGHSRGRQDNRAARALSDGDYQRVATTVSDRA